MGTKRIKNRKSNKYAYVPRKYGASLKIEKSNFINLYKSFSPTEVCNRYRISRDELYKILCDFGIEATTMKNPEPSLIHAIAAKLLVSQSLKSYYALSTEWGVDEKKLNKKAQEISWPEIFDTIQKSEIPKVIERVSIPWVVGEGPLRADEVNYSIDPE
jgi:hypothetical protein